MTADLQNLQNPSLYTNREISWLDFNSRVLAMAMRSDVPLLERLKFVAIASSNLDEFYMVRVAALMREVARQAASIDPSGDARAPAEVLRDIGVYARAMSEATGQILTDLLLPDLARHGVRFLTPADAPAAKVEAYYRKEVHPVLTPIAIDPAHPLPQLRNKSLNLALRLDAAGVRARPGAGDAPTASDGTLLALVQVPKVLPRFVPFEVEGAQYAFMPLESIISMHASELFPGHKILDSCAFRVTRAADLEFVEEDAENLLATIQDELRRRDRGEAIRLEVSSGSSDDLVEMLRVMLAVEELHVHRSAWHVATADLMSVYGQAEMAALRDERFTPVPSAALRFGASIFRSIAERDVLLHHPYESFGHVVEFIEAAANDPDVVAIKQTLYRTSGDSPIVRALARAAQNGKQVTALVELKARFDEAANIAWARALEESGVHVVYGLIGLKTHGKLLLVIRREGTALKRYLHISTGNYNPSTARLYTDLSLLTARDDLTGDAMQLFNVLTGYAELPPLRRLIVAPFTLRQHLVEMIARETEHAKAGRPSGIIAKMNSLVDPGIIRALYRASQAGVRIELIVRGICCLRPGIPGVSETIRVRGVVDRFLEHARMFWWANGGEDELYLASADWMPRNLTRRIEVCFPILDPGLKKRIKDEILKVELADNVSAWVVLPDGSWTPAPRPDGEELVRSQQVFLRQARERASTARTAVRREVSALSASAGVTPAMRAAQLQAWRRRSAGGHEPV